MVNRNEFRPVVGFEELYEVSNYGVVRSLDRYIESGNRIIFRKGKILKQFINPDGYSVVVLCSNGKPYTKMVHRLVLEAFKPNNDEEHKTQCNHIDEDKTNNMVDNLEWVTPSYNINWGTRNERVSKAMKGKNNPNFGKKFSQEHIEKCIKHHEKKIYQYTIEGELIAEYKSVKEAAEANGYERSNLSRAACGGKIRYGHKWSYDRA